MQGPKWLDQQSDRGKMQSCAFWDQRADLTRSELLESGGAFLEMKQQKFTKQENQQSSGQLKSSKAIAKTINAATAWDPCCQIAVKTP